MSGDEDNIGAEPEPAVPVREPALPVLREKTRDWSLDDPLDTQAAYEVIEGIAFGRTMRDLEREPHLPPMNLFLVWVMKNPQLALAFNKAREISGFILEDEILDLLREGWKSPDTTLKAKHLQMLTDGMWKIAAKRNPSVFGEKSTVNVTVPVSINTSLDLGKGGEAVQRENEITNIYQLRAEVEREIETDLPMEIAQRDPETGRRRVRRVVEIGKRTATRTLKRVLVPKRRAAETAVEREAREKAQRILADRREARRRSARVYRDKKPRVNARRVDLGGDNDGDA